MELRIRSDQIGNYRQRVSDYRVLLKHKERKNAINNYYKQKIREVVSGKAVVVIDFKQKILVGHEPNEISANYRNMKQRSVLGICVITEAGHFYFDCVSRNLSQSGYIAKKCIVKIMARDEFRHVLEVDIFADVGTHFRCKELIPLWAPSRDVG